MFNIILKILGSIYRAVQAINGSPVTGNYNGINDKSPANIMALPLTVTRPWFAGLYSNDYNRNERRENTPCDKVYILIMKS